MYLREAIKCYMEIVKHKLYISFIVLCTLVSYSCKKENLNSPSTAQTSQIEPKSTSEYDDHGTSLDLVKESIDLNGGWDNYLSARNIFIGQEKTFFDSLGNQVDARKDYVYLNMEEGFRGNIYWIDGQDSHSIQYGNGVIEYLVSDKNVTDATNAKPSAQIYFVNVLSILNSFLIKGNAGSFVPIESIELDGVSLTGISGHVAFERALGLPKSKVDLFFDESQLKIIRVNSDTGVLWMELEGRSEHKNLMLPEKIVNYSVDAMGKRTHKISEYKNNYGER